jgi:HEAT repeat protein
MGPPRLSLVVRFHNEAEYLGAALRAIRAQRGVPSVEIVAVDNASTDGSRAVAQEYADILLDISDYRPGRALNASISACTGDKVVALSAHALPANDRWLADLTGHLRNPDVLGVYGAQIYPITSKFLDKRDLDIFADIEPRTETRDSDFWNANSAFDRSSWEKQPFDQTVIELEDHHWTKQILPGGDRWVRYEPTAKVYHYGHEKRNDRQFLPPGDLTAAQRVDTVLADLSGEVVAWPIAMSAGLTAGSLSGSPEARRAVPALGRHLLTYPDFDVRWRMAGALGRLAYPESVPFLVRGLADPSFYARDECAWSLARLGPLAVPAVVAALPTIDAAARPFAALALGRSGVDDGVRVALDVLESCVGCGDESIERDALYFLGEVGQLDEHPGLLPAVIDRIVADDYRTAWAAVWCWGVLAEAGKAPDGAATIAEIARRHPVDVLRAEAVVALGRIPLGHGFRHGLDEVTRTLCCDGAGRVRYAAMQTLRLAAERGVALAGEAARSHAADDDDFGVLFERSLTFVRHTGR